MRQFQSTLPASETTGVPERTVDLETLFFDYNKFHHPKGADMFGRIQGWTDWLDKLKTTRLFLYSRRTLTPPGTECHGQDEYGETYYGLNFASADYLGLSQAEESKEAAVKAAQEFGVNSCGSPLAFGGHKYYYQLIEELQDFWNVKHCMLFSTGWLGGFGVIKCLVKQNDHVVMDALSHNCLIEGSKAATKNIHKVKHLCNESMEAKIKELREKFPNDGIFVVTEGLFSMDADTTDLVGLQKITKKYGAFMMIDSAHDFGCMGEEGKGAWEELGLQDFSNVILCASGSKCLSTNLGFVGCNNRAVIEYLKIHCTAYMFTNAINPIQCATALSQLRILRGQIGKQIRAKVIDNYNFTKELLAKKGYECIGRPCPILIVFIGNEVVSRLVGRLMMDEGVHVNGIEYPVVGMGEARLRLNLMPQHSRDNMEIFVDIFDKVFKKATIMFEEAMEVYQQMQEKRAEEEEKRELEEQKQQQQNNNQSNNTEAVVAQPKL